MVIRRLDPQDENDFQAGAPFAPSEKPPNEYMPGSNFVPRSSGKSCRLAFLSSAFGEDKRREVGPGLRAGPVKDRKLYTKGRYSKSGYGYVLLDD